MSKPFELKEGRFCLTEVLEIKQMLNESGNPSALTDAAKSGTSENPKKLLVTVEAIHAKMTKNNTMYPANRLESSAGTWTDIYDKPVLKNHSSYTEPLGRVKSSNFTDSKLIDGVKCIALDLLITDSDAIQKVLDGRYKTLSIGATTNEARCSICGKNVVEEYCGHWKGNTYEGQKCYYIIGEMEFDEISFVNMPADVHSQVIGHKVQDSVKDSQTEEGRIILVTDETVIDPTILDQVTALATPPVIPVVAEGVPEVPPVIPVVTDVPPVVPAVTTEEITPELVASLQEQITVLEAKLATATQEHEVSRQSLTQTQADVTRLTDELRVASEESASMLKQNVSLATYSHRLLAERVVDLKIHLGKEANDKRDDLIANHIKENAQALNDGLTVLLTEQPVRVIQPVTLADAAGQSTLESTTAKPQVPHIPTLEEYANTVVSYLTKTV